LLPGKMLIGHAQSGCILLLYKLAGFWGRKRQSEGIVCVFPFFRNKTTSRILCVTQRFANGPAATFGSSHIVAYFPFNLLHRIAQHPGWLKCSTGVAHLLFICVKPSLMQHLPVPTASFLYLADMGCCRYTIGYLARDGRSEVISSPNKLSYYSKH
jgi:hypothetical protein